MKPSRVLNFNSYTKLFEEESSTPVKTIREIISLFFKCYMFVATKAVDYKDVLADLISVSEEKDPAKRSETMESVIKKVAEKIDPKYATIKEDAIKAATSIKEIYAQVASTEDAKKNADAINKMVTSKIVNYQDILKNEPLTLKEHANVYGFDQYSFPLLYEKNTFDDERAALTDKMKSLYSEMISQKKYPSNETLKAKADEVVSKFDEYQKLLSDKGAWEKMKRKERKEKLETMNAEIDDMIQKANQLQKSELAKIGVDKKIADTMSNIITSINSMSDKAKIIDDKAIADAKDAEEKKNQEKVEYKVGDIVKYKKDNGEEEQSEIIKIEGDKVYFKDKDGKEFSKEKKDLTGKVEGKEEDKDKGEDISSGNVDKENLKKDGPNVEAIKKFQEDYNNLEIGKKLNVDGLYGKNTEIAIDKVAKMIKNISGKDINTDGGKKLTGDLQDNLKKLLANKDKIKEILG